MAIVFLFQFVTAYGSLCLKRLLVDIPASNSVFFLLIFLYETSNRIFIPTYNLLSWGQKLKFVLSEKGKYLSLKLIINYINYIIAKHLIHSKRLNA